jgi:hypothetical protein
MDVTNNYQSGGLCQPSQVQPLLIDRRKLLQRMNHFLLRPRFGKMFSRWFAPFILALLGLGFFPHCSQAAANVNISIWHGYSVGHRFYYPQIGISGTPTPVTFHWLENADGTLWRQVGSTNGNSGAMATNDLAAVIHVCTNGLWKLYFNRGDVSEEIFYFKVNITGVTPAVLTPVEITYPQNNSTGVESNPTFTWTGPTGWEGILGTVFTGNFVPVYNDDLPGTTTSWSPGSLAAGEHDLLLVYYTNNYPGISLSTPTNSVGTPVAEWTGNGNLNSYMYSSFNVTGGSGGDPALGEAVDAPYLVWTTGGDANWFSQTEEKSDGSDAAQSGPIGDGEESWIETTVVGPGFLFFAWNVSSDDQDGYDYLELTVNGIVETEISGNGGWDFYDVYLDEGVYTLRWTYRKDGEFTAGQDAAWLDDIYYAQEVEMDISLVIQRSNDPLNPSFISYPSLNWYYPDPITSYEIVAPGSWSSGYVDQDDNESTAGSFATLGDLITALESGDWTVYVNRNHPQQRVFKFSVGAADLDLSDLPAVNFTSPTEGQTGIATNHVFTWTGPNDFNGLFLSSYAVPFAPSGGFTNLTATLKSTRMPNALVEGTNNIFINYGRYDVADVEISYPEDDFGTSFYSWNAQTDLQLTQTRKFVVGSQLPPATPVEILNPQNSGGNLGFSFLTQAGRTHTIQSRTNLNTAPWLNRTNFVGDGQVWQFNFPIGPAPESYFRVGTQ